MDRFAQGDVLLVRVDGLQFKDSTRVDTKNGAILQHGEHTNHVHALWGGNVAMFHDEGLARPEAKGLYLGHVMLKEPADLEHGTGPGKNDGDHATINLPAGTYEVRGQQEVSEDELTRPVSD